MYHIAGGMWISRLGDHGVRAIEPSAHRRPRTIAPPGSDERLVRHDLPRVRDEPEQDDACGSELKCARRARVTAWATRDACRGRPGNSTGEPGNTPDDLGNVPSATSHSRG